MLNEIKAASEQQIYCLPWEICRVHGTNFINAEYIMIGLLHFYHKQGHSSFVVCRTSLGNLFQSMHPIKAGSWIKKSVILC